MGTQAGQERPANTGEEAPQPDLPPQDGEAGDVTGGYLKRVSDSEEHYPKGTLS